MSERQALGAYIGANFLAKYSSCLTVFVAGLLCCMTASAVRASVSDLERYALAAYHQMDGQHGLAIPLAKELGDPVISEAGAVLIGESLMAQGEYASAEKHYSDALENSDYLGLHRGELLLGRSLAVCFQAADVESLRQASGWLDQASEWCEKLSQQDQVDLLRDTAAKVCMPAAITAGPFHASPRSAVPTIQGVVVNPLTADWYSDEVHRVVQRLKLYVDSRAGIDLKLTEEQAKSFGLSRLWMDAQDGAFLIGPDAWSSLTKDHAFKLRFGFFLIASGQPDPASDLFREVHEKSKDSVIDSRTWGAVTLGSAICAIQMGNSQRGLQSLGRFESELRNTPVTPLAWYVMANHLAGSGDKKTRDRAYRLYGDVASQHKDSPYAMKALLAMAVCAANQNDGAMLNEAQRLLREAEAPQTVIDLSESLSPIGSFDPNEDASPVSPKRRPGELEPVEVRVIKSSQLYPADISSQKSSSDSNGLSDAVMAIPQRTILRCHLAYDHRSERIAVDSFQAHLSVLEPRPPLGKQGWSSFYRMPYLWGSSAGVSE